MDQSVFLNKEIKPTPKLLGKALGETLTFWNEIQDFTLEKYPKATKNWHFTGKVSGWSYRISDTKRVIVYLLPREGFFRVALVFGQKAVDDILLSNISDEIKKELLEAKVFAEGRGIRIKVMDDSQLAEIKKLIEIKIAH
ncbi:MAG: DUF3788 family protein [Bacteroidota bacterium]